MKRLTVLLDTSFLIDIERRRPLAKRCLERLAQAGEDFVIPTLVAAEFLAGSRDPVRDLEALHTAGDVTSFTFRDAVAAGALARRAYLRGRYPGPVDFMIAGVAASRGGLRIVTANPKHFPESKTMTY